MKVKYRRIYTQVEIMSKWHFDWKREKRESGDWRNLF